MNGVVVFNITTGEIRKCPNRQAFKKTMKEFLETSEVPIHIEISGVEATEKDVFSYFNSRRK